MVENSHRLTICVDLIVVVAGQKYSLGSDLLQTPVQLPRRFLKIKKNVSISLMTSLSCSYKPPHVHVRRHTAVVSVHSPDGRDVKRFSSLHEEEDGSTASTAFVTSSALAWTNDLSLDPYDSGLVIV